jgi:hypothetical protein
LFATPTTSSLAAKSTGTINSTLDKPHERERRINAASTNNERPHRKAGYGNGYEIANGQSRKTLSAGDGC